MVRSRTWRDRGGAALLLCAALAAGLATSRAEAARLRRVGLGDMARRAERIFVGRCVQRSVAPDPDTGLPSTLYTFQVAEPVKGTPADTTAFRMLGTPEEPFAAGFPSFEVGEEALLFLYPPGRSGFTSPIALDQGRFRIAADGGRGRRAANGIGNAGLLSDVPHGLLRLHGLESSAHGALPLGRLVALARALASGSGDR